MARLLGIPLVLLLLVAAALVWSGRQAEGPADFTLVNRWDVRSLDPNTMSWMEDIRLGYALYEGLYALDPESLDPIPGIASSHELNADKTVYTFHLRTNAGWSNGDPLTTADFVFAWRRMLEQPGDYSYLFDYIKGAAEYRKAFADGGRGDFGSVGIEAVDARTLRVTLAHPVAFFLDLVAFPPFFPMNERAMAPFRVRDAETGAVSYRSEFMRPPNLVSNGPYRLARWDFKQRLRLVANDHYWDRANVKSRVIDEIIVSDNKLGEFLRYDGGMVDLLVDLDPQIATGLIAQGERDPAKRRMDLHIFPAFGTYFYCINCQERLKDGSINPFRDKRVRRAFAMAVDRKPIVETVTRLGERPANHFVPPGIFKGYESPVGIPDDPEGARKLLAEAGYPRGSGFPRTTLTFSTEGVHAEVAQVVQRQWEKALGVHVELEGVEPAIFSDRLHNQEYSIARGSWYGDYNDVSTFTDKNLSGSDNNDSKWVNAEYDRLCDEASRETDPVKRLGLLRRAEQIFLDEAPIIPVYYYVNTFMFRENVRGVSLSPRNMTMFKAVQRVGR